MSFSTETITILDYLCEKFGVAIDWTSETIWPTLQMLAEKFIRWEIVTSIIWMLIWVISFIPCAIGTKKIIKHVKTEKHGTWYDSDVFCCAFCCIGMLLFFCFFSSQVFDIAKCIVFPEMEIFEYLKQTLNTMSR